MRKKIIVVDDEEIQRDIVEGVLENLYQVITVASGEECLSIAARECPDLILMDGVMDGLDGYETSERLKDEPGTNMIPIIFLSGHDSEFERKEAFKVGAIDFIMKPVNAADLLSVVEMALSSA